MIRPANPQKRIESIAHDIAHEINVSINYAVSEARVLDKDPYNESGKLTTIKDMRLDSIIRIKKLLVELQVNE